MSHIIAELESLILQSRTLTLEDKQRLLETLPALSEEKLREMKAVFEDEKRDFERIAKQELFAWNQFRMALQTLTSKTKQKLTT